MNNLRKLLLYGTTLFVVCYCLSVLYYVHAAWDLGLRGLFSNVAGGSSTVAKGRMIGWAEDALPAVPGGGPGAGDILLRIAGRDVPSSLHVQSRITEAADGFDGADVVRDVPPAELDKLPPTKTLAEFDGHRWLRVEYQRAIDGQETSAWLMLQSSSGTAVWLSSAWFLLEMVIFAIGAVAVWRRPGDAVALLFFLLCTINAVTFMGAFHWPSLLGSKLLVYPFVVCAMLLTPMMLHFFVLFPRPLGVARAWPRATAAVIYAVPGIWMLLLFYYIHKIDALFFVPEATAELSQLLSKLAGTIYAYLAASVSIYLVGFGVLVYRYLRARTTQERKQVWGLLSAVMLTIGPVGYLLVTAGRDRAEFAFGPMPKLMVYLTSLIFTTAYGLSITRYKLFSIGRVVNRGLLYFGISSLFCTLVGLATALVGQYYFRWENALMAGFTAMVVVVFLGWFRDRLQKSLDRSFYREKYRLDKAVRQLGAAVDRLVEPEQLALQLLKGARDTIGNGSGVVYLRETGGDAFTPVAVLDWPTVPAPLAAAHPLIAELSLTGVLKGNVAGGSKALRSIGAELGYLLELEGAIVGAAFFSSRDDAVPYSPEDMNFTAALVRTTALALSTAAGHATIRTLKEELQEKVAKISEQQRRIMYLQGELLTRHDADRHADEPGFGRQAEAPDDWRSEILGSSPTLSDVLNKAAKAAVSPSSVLIRGESGTGKELLARAIHRHSPRAAKQFVTVHCAALSSSLLESELFGHVKGAFTGADRDRQGRFELADGGTLFLDEIGDITLETQTKLLRVLQERSFERVGGVQTIAVDVRLIAATHQNLEELIREGRFREDLFYRLNVISLRCPSLRERKEDIFELALYFLRHYAGRSNKSPTRIEEEALDVLSRYDWPGNIRQLENAVERAVVLCEGDSIRVEDLPPEIVTAVRAAPSSSSGTSAPRNRVVARREPAAPRPRRSAVAVEAVVSATALGDELDHLERERISEALLRANGNKTEAAKLLGLPRSTLFSKLRKFGFE